FFTSRRQHTRSKRDWSSDVCSSDLLLINNRLGSSFGTSGKLPRRRWPLVSKKCKYFSRSSFNPVHCIQYVLPSIGSFKKVHEKIIAFAPLQGRRLIASVVPPGLLLRLCKGTGSRFACVNAANTFGSTPKAPGWLCRVSVELPCTIWNSLCRLFGPALAPSTPFSFLQS